MKQFFIDNFDTILMIASGLLTALGAFLGITNIRISKVKKLLNGSKSNGYRIRCPHCKKESPIEEVSFLLPSGAVDNNLNGVPDEQE